MKKLRGILLLLFTLVCGLMAFAACGDDDGKKDGGKEEEKLREITGVTFTDKTVDYDGEEHEITITGTLPEGVSVVYSCAGDSTLTNKARSAGVYEITATLSGASYKTLTLTAKLTINGTDITGVTFTDKTETYNGTEYEITVAGTLPSGVSVAYSNNKGTNAGTYNATAKLTGEGYNPLTLYATLEIEKAALPTITFNGKTETYNGNPYSVAIDESNLPAGTSVVYSCAEDPSVTHSATNAGIYHITLTVTNPNYNTFTKTVTLEIGKAQFPTITFNGDTVTCDGKPHTIEISVEGTLPAGTSVVYSCAEDPSITNTASEVGTYTIKVTVTNPNYETFAAEATLQINANSSLAGIAQGIIAAFGNVPDVWAFLPESFRLTEERAYSGSVLDFTKSVSVENIPVTGIGKQLDVVYGTVINMQNLLGYVNTFYASAGTIANLYQTFINNHPDNYRVFESQTDGGAIRFRIELDDKQYTLLAKMGSVALELYADADDGSYSGRVQLSDTNALKYDVGQNSLKIGLNILNTATTQLEFEREDGVVTGYLYESLGATVAGAKREISTSALLTWDGDYVSVAGTNGDFFPGADGEVVELYDAGTGRYLGAKVKENKYNTYWFNLADIEGINSVRVENKQNVLNANTIYLNGAQTAIKTKIMGISFGTKSASRRFDIEMKKTYFYTYDAASEKFTKIDMEIPMLFVQEEVYDDLVGDMNSTNSISITVNVAVTTKSTLDTYYVDGLAAYDEIADLVTGDDIIAYVGSKHPYFN